MAEPAERVANDDAPTEVDAPLRVREKIERPSAPPAASGSQSGAEGSSKTSVVTPRETLHLQEIARTRTFVRIALGLALASTLTLPFVGGDAFAKRIFMVGILLAAASCLWLGIVIRNDAGYTVPRAVLCGYCCMAAGFTGIYFFGVNSPAPVVIPFGLYFFGAGQSDRATLTVYLTCAITYGALGILMIAGALADRGLVRGTSLPTLELIAIHVLVQATFVASYVGARKGRNATIYAIEQHDRVLRAMAQREALLKEVKQDLAQALRVGGLGGYTDRVIGSFKLGQIIGRGAMGEVYEAKHVTTGEEAAVKLLLDHVLAQPDHVERFYREAKIVTSLNAANVVRVLAVADRDCSIPYIAMERLHGQDLADWLRARRRLTLPIVLTMIRQVGQGLEAARASGIVHRDLKPRNLFLAKFGNAEVWKILDFGVSKLLGEDHTLTREARVGTPSYMAPEQITGGTISHRTDIFALGVIAYRSLTGRPAFSGDSESEILYKVLHVMPPAPSEGLSLPPELDLVMAIALAKEPDDRFESAAELAQALEAASKGHVDPALAHRAQRLLAKFPWGT